MAVINITKGMTTVKGTVGNDEINLKESVGNGIVINADAGNDVITVTRGDNHTINAGPGADFVSVASGKNYKIDLGEGNDRVDLWGSEGHIVTAVSGTNNLNINSGSGYKITGGAGVDRLTIKGTNSNNTAYLGSGQDVLGMATGSNNVVHGGGDNDYFIVSGGENSSFYGDEGDDTLRLYRGDGHIVYAGAGNDSMLVTEANNSKVYGSAGKNQIMFFGGTGNEYYGGNEKDNITLKNKAEAVKVVGGEKATVVNVQVGDKHVIDLSNSTNTVTQIMAGSGTMVTGGDGKDTLRVWGTTDNLSAYLGDGNDLINVKGGTDMRLSGGAGADEFQILGGHDNTYYGNAGDDYITVAAANNTIYGDHSVARQYKFDLEGASYNDTILVNKEATDCNVYAGRGNNYIELHSARCKVTSDSDDDTVVVKDEIGTDYDKLKNGGTNLEISTNEGNDNIIINSGGEYHGMVHGTYITVSAGEGNDVITFQQGDHRYYNDDAFSCVFGGSGSDTFILGAHSIVAYGGNGNDTFINYANLNKFGNFMVGGAGNDTYTFDCTQGLCWENIYSIDNKTHLGSQDKDVIKFIGYTGDINNIELHGWKDESELRGMTLYSPDGDKSKMLNIYINGFDSISEILICDEFGKTIKNLGSGKSFNQRCIDEGRFVSASLGWTNVDQYLASHTTFDSSYWDSVKTFASKDYDLKITGNGF